VPFVTVKRRLTKVKGVSVSRTPKYLSRFKSFDELESIDELVEAEEFVTLELESDD
jgi:hypothetical protein